MNQIYSQCDNSEHPNEYILGLCFNKSCLQKPQYCYLCKTEGIHMNHQNQCKSFSNLKKKIQETNSTLFIQKEQLLQTFKSVSQYLSDILYQTYQKKLDECQLLIQISKEEDVVQSKIKIDLFSYYLNLNLEELRNFIDKIEGICQKFNNEIQQVMDECELPFINGNSVVESLNSNIQNDAKSQIYYNSQELNNQDSQKDNQKEDNDQLQNQINQQEEDDFFKLQLQLIQEAEQNEKIQQSLQLTDQAKQNAENPQVAIGMLDEALQIYENNEDALVLKGVILFKQEKYDLSMKPFEKLIELNSQIPNIYKLYADCLFYENRLKEADQFYQRAIQMNPIDSSIYSNRGNVLISLHKYQEAIDCCDKAISLNQEFPSAYHNKAQALACQNKFQEALQNYDLAIKYKPDFILSLAKKGVLLLRLNKLEEAIVCLNKIEQLSEQSPYTYELKTEILRKQGKLAEALETCNQGLSFYPKEIILLHLKQKLHGYNFID